MEEKQLIEREIMSEEEFANYLRTSVNLMSFDCVLKFKSVCRAFRRGNISRYGTIYPRRPFNNRKNTSKRKGANSRYTNKIKKDLYVELNSRNQVV